ncbi:MetQ/NlpA family ABC transporter substrate-binding protein [Staphylococcus saprophyticus]|uniref:MetQ/NlpA family ABC transporter substrate-binding protein n=1 Tax=Staphylococcus saprophyticus TaxID=29385 RepID=UPI0029765B99|nr:MetQ/NlpA family ABC transporter substrate-binding protein [Staphylococcus saprophyticus]MDW4388760.1 MetQ/NlpA family ABC transporter substrate-binding protein [Staphylococcus saprophyticus]MEB6801610.1 MetQ/NlpA family ABC transporter substrate-binding protein [Staphylococcus saprophyticus]
MRKWFILGSLFVLTIILAACGKSNGEKEDKEITIAASPAPHGVVLEHAKEEMKKKGYDLKIKTVNDYKVPNKLLDRGDVDANAFQHTPYLKAEKKDHNYKIEEAGKVFTTPMGVYSKKYKDIKDIPKGSTIYVSNNPAEEGRFLSFFVDKGLIKIKKGVSIEDAKFDDIVENKKDLKFNNKQGAEFLPKTYNSKEGAAVIMNSNYAIDNGLTPHKDAIAIEGKSSPFANIVAVQEGHKNDKKFKELMKVLQSKEMKKFITDKYGQDVIPYEK